MKNISKESKIQLYFHCKNCMVIKGEDISSTEELAMGWTKKGVQVVCENCGHNILNLDFQGQKVITI